MAIEDGLRYLWVSQENRAANFPAATTTRWPGQTWRTSYAALVALAFQNHGYKLPNNDGPVTGLYQKYIVQRALDYVVSGLSTVTLGLQGSNDPCQGVGTDCVGLRETRHDTFHEAYTTAVAVLPLAASGALSRKNSAGNALTNYGNVVNYTVGKTYGEILQRMANTIVWGQIDSGTGRGGWFYNFNSTSSFDGSTVGWDLLALLDASAAGAVVPAFAKTEFAFGLNGALNTDGTLDYQGNGNAGSNNSVGPQKNGIGLQGLYFTGETTGLRVVAVTNAISSWWNGTTGVGGNSWGGCPTGNMGCAYTMFNNFKGLKLHGIETLPGVTRPAGPGSQPAGDWYADYQDWLVTNQTAPNTLNGGNWATMGFSCCDSTAAMESAIAELILSPVALVLPDADKFGEFGLSLETDTAVEGNSHTVTAHAESTGGTPVPGATVNFEILTGRNVGLTGTDTTDSNGEATFTYIDGGPVGTTGTDTIQASIGSLNSNIVNMVWTPLNAPPVAVDDAYATDEDVAVTSNVTANDSDPDGDVVTASLVSGTSNGVLVFNPDGSFTYTPAPNWFGVDSFSYLLNDGTVNGNTATVTISIAPKNDLPVCLAAAPSVSQIWPPNHKLVNVTIGGVVDPVEGSAITINVDSIYQDEPTNTNGDGNTPIDGYGVGTDTAQVRAERTGDKKNPGNGRMYHITFTATDAEGGKCTAVVTVGVPHDQGKGKTVIDEGPIYKSTGGA